MRARLPAAISIALLLGCVEPPDISRDLERYGIHVNDVNELSCECPMLFGYETPMQCSENLPSVGADEWRCLTTTLEGHEEAALDYLECANAAYETYVNCLEGTYNCYPFPHDSCALYHESALAECPQLPDDVQAAFDACTE